MVSETAAVRPRSAVELVRPLCRTQQQLEGTSALLRYLCATPEARKSDGEAFVVTLRSSVQITRGMGLPQKDTTRATMERWQTQVKRWLTYLAPLGVEFETAERLPHRGNRGIIIRVPAGVAQLVRAAES